MENNTGYRLGEWTLALYIPAWLVVCMASPILLSLLLPPMFINRFYMGPLHNVLDTIIIVCLCGAFFLVYRTSRHIPPERIRATDRLFGRVLLVFALYNLFSLIIMILGWSLASIDTPYRPSAQVLLMRCLPILGAVIYYAIWGWGLVRRQPKWAVIGVLSGWIVMELGVAYPAQPSTTSPFFSKSFTLLFALLTAYTFMRFSNLCHSPVSNRKEAICRQDSPAVQCNTEPM